MLFRKSRKGLPFAEDGATGTLDVRANFERFLAKGGERRESLDFSVAKEHTWSAFCHKG